MDPLISIVIATYNAGALLRECLASISAQACKEIEIVVVDGGSTDNTISILQSFNSRPLTWITEPDKGIYDAFNKGIKLARGRWLYFMGTDDLLLPGFSELASMLENEQAVYYGISKPLYRDKRSSYDLITGKFTKYRLAKYCMNHQAILYPASVFSKYEYSLRYKIYADYDLNIKVWGDSSFKKIFHPIEIVLYNMSGFSATATDDLFKSEKPMLVKKSLGWFVYLRFLYKRYRKKKEGRDDFY